MLSTAIVIVVMEMGSLVGKKMSMAKYRLSLVYGT